MNVRRNDGNARMNESTMTASREGITGTDFGTMIPIDEGGRTLDQGHHQTLAKDVLQGLRPVRGHLPGEWTVMIDIVDQSRGRSLHHHRHLVEELTIPMRGCEPALHLPHHEEATPLTGKGMATLPEGEIRPLDGLFALGHL